MSKVYLGAPIDQHSSDPGVNFKVLADVALRAFDGQPLVMFNPFTAYMNAGGPRNSQTIDYVVGTNMEALSESSLAVFMWDNQPTFGVVVEIVHCADKGIPFIILNKSGKKPGIYMEYVVSDPKISCIVDSTEQLESKIKKFITSGSME